MERLKRALDPSLILLFGSCARGTATRKSDVDLLVVWESQDPPLERIGQLLEMLADGPRPVEAIAYTSQELDARRGSPFIRSILREGRVLYERGKAQSGRESVVASG